MGGSSVTSNPQFDSPSTVVRAVETPALSAKSPVFSDDSSDGESVRVKSSQLNRLMDMLVELVMLRNQRQTELTVLQEVYHELITSGSKMRLLSNDRGLCSDSSTSLQLSEVASDVLETAQQVRDCTRPFADGNAAVSRFIRQFRQELVELRRTPISGLFRRLQLVAREAARAESKQVRLALTGEDAGIERALQQRLYEPLLHIVRNAIGHGIESPEDRIKNGKNSEGVVTLEAISGPNLFVIEVRDDGSGLDYEAIRRRGVERKLIAADQVVNRDELSQLIFHPGFSTRESANQVGGRGVGMDVVASTVQRMRGWLEVTSEPGQGTRIRLSIPLPSVIQHAMVFRCADQLFALPMESVQSAGDLSREIPRTSFAQLLGLERTQANGTDQTILIADDHNGSMQGKASLALFVDEIIGPEELVVRPLPSLLKHHPYCVGATLSGMGQTVILLDARRLLKSQTIPLAKSMPLSKTSAVASGTKPSSKRPRVLVVDDSVSARKRVIRSLSRYPLDIVEASDGKEALESLKKQHFAAVFSDMEMPNVDGMELLANISASGRSDSPPVIIISSRSEREFTERARQLGAANYLIKPLVDEDLDAALLRLETLSHLVRDVTLNELEKPS
jgi:chemotaxis protein histidine kinase CheA/ActR/RegA family two-component response regulator